MNDRVLEVAGDIAVWVAGLVLGFALMVGAELKEKACERPGAHSTTKAD